MTITKARIIDVEAEKVLRSFIPSEWLIRKQDPDIHIDFRIEIANYEPTGLNFCVQLKGHEKFKDNFCIQQMKTKHLVYYLDKVRDPVFLFFVNTSEKKMYWLFLQEYLLLLPNNRWREKKSLTLKIPLNNELADSKTFITIIEKSDLFMRDLWPASISPTMHFHQKQLNNIDPRFIINIAYNEGQTSYNITPKAVEKIDFKLKIFAKNNINVKRLFTHGETVTIPQSGLNIEGLPLFTHLLKEYTGDIKISFKKETPVDLLAYINNDKSKLIHGFKAKLTGGYAHLNLKICLPNSPFQCSCSFFEDNGKVGFGNKMDFDFVFDNWDGYHISELPFINQIALIMQAFKNGNEIQFDISSKGESLFPLKLLPNVFPENDNLYQYINLLQKLNSISKYFAIDYLYNDVHMISYYDAALIYNLCTFIETGCMQIITPQATAAVTLLLTPKLFKDLRENPIHLEGIKDRGRDYTVHLCGKKLTISNIELEMQNLIIVTKTSDLQENQIGQEIIIHLRGTDSTINTIRRLDYSKFKE